MAMILATATWKETASSVLKALAVNSSLHHSADMSSIC